MPAATQEAKPPAVTAGPVKSDQEVVLTITGSCPAGNAAPVCKTTLTKGEFERLIAAVRPGLEPQDRRQLASIYTQLLVVANEGQKAGLEKDPIYQERIRLERLRLLAQMMEQRMREGTDATDEEIETFYAENRDRFEELQLRRVVVPKSIATEAKPEDTKVIAEALMKRAAAGEDTDKLQLEAYQQTKQTAAPPSTNLGWKPRGAMDPRWEPQVVALKAGQITPVMEEAQNYHFIKVESKRMVPLQQVKPEIAKRIQFERFEVKMRQLLANIKADFNESYFGPAQPQQQPMQPPQVPPNQQR